MQSLLQYLANLANDPAAQQKFSQNPDAAIEAADLSDQDKSILRTRNAGLIHATVGQQALAAMIYASEQPAMIYASQPPAMIYGSQQPAMIYGSQQPAMIYGSQHPAMIYASQPP